MNPVVKELKKEAIRRLFEESVPRIKKCLGLLTEQQIWESPNENIPSIGNLILHIYGNASQWTLAGIGNKKDTRERSKEFGKSDYSKNDLIKKLNLLETELTPFIQEITKEQLTDIKKVQCFKETGTAILVHVIEHFSYHTGQITTLTKLIINKDLEYYANFDLED